MATTGTAKARTGEGSRVAELARFFPEAMPVRIPVELTRGIASDGHAGKLALPEQASPEQTLSEQTLTEQTLSKQTQPEQTVIEFGTAREVLFCCSAPLEFAEAVRLRNAEGSLDIEASVVAVQYHPGATVVAARFLKAVPNWIVKS